MKPIAPADFFKMSSCTFINRNNLSIFDNIILSLFKTISSFHCTNNPTFQGKLNKLFLLILYKLVFEFFFYGFNNYHHHLINFPFRNFLLLLILQIHKQLLSLSYLCVWYDLFPYYLHWSDQLWVARISWW